MNGHVTGGPAYYIRAAFKGKVGKVLATVFSVLIILALVLPTGFWWFALGGALIAAGVWLLRCCGGITAVCPA